MLKMLTLGSLILLFLWKHGQAEPQCGVPYSQPNFKLQGHVIQKHSVQTSDQCTEKCALNADCHSINFYSNQGICELNNANHLSNPESLVPSAGGQYMNYLLRAVPRCSNKLCSHPLECKVDEDGQSHKCVSCEGRLDGFFESFILRCCLFPMSQYRALCPVLWRLYNNGKSQRD